MGAVTGVAEHNGWAELVTVGVEASRPVLLDRRRVELVDAGLPESYHHEGLALPLAEADGLTRVRESVARRARAALAELGTSFATEALTIRQSPFPSLPASLAEVLESYPLTCAADGMMYREALADAGAALGMAVDRFPRKADPLADAARACDVSAGAIADLLGEMGRSVGSPWRKEHRLAGAAALRVLAGRERVSLRI